MTLQELTRSYFTNDMNNHKSKKAVRDSVKLALSLYQKNKLDKETLEAIASLAMAWEISTDIENKFGKTPK
jgi:hypothetical protein